MRWKTKVEADIAQNGKSVEAEQHLHPVSLKLPCGAVENGFKVWVDFCCVNKKR